MKHHLVVFALVTLVSEVFAVQGTLVTESEELKGDIRWDAEKKHYVVVIRRRTGPARRPHHGGSEGQQA